MTKTTMFQITNYSKRDLYLWPKDERAREEWGILIKAGEFIIKDFTFLKISLDLNDCYFQFHGMKRKIKPQNLKKYNVDLVCFL